VRNLILAGSYKISPFGRDDNLFVGHDTRECLALNEFLPLDGGGQVGARLQFVLELLGGDTGGLLKNGHSI
jgi:hypothetical protein